MRGGVSPGPGCSPALRRCRRHRGPPRSNAAPPPPPLKTLHTHLGQRAGLLVLARGLAMQTAVANGRVLRGGEQDPPHFTRRRPKRPAWRSGEVSPSSPEGHSGWSGRSRDPRCHLQLTPLPLGLVWWERCWRAEIREAAAEVAFAGRPTGSGCRARRNRAVGGPRCAGRRRRRHGPAGKPRRSEGLVFVLTRPRLLRQPASVLCCAGRGGSRQTLPPSGEPAGCLGGISPSPPPQAKASVAHTPATF